MICPTKTTNKYHALQPVKNNTRYYIVVAVQNDLWGQSITVRSPLQVKYLIFMKISFKKLTLFENVFIFLADEKRDVFSFGTLLQEKRFR